MNMATAVPTIIMALTAMNAVTRRGAMTGTSDATGEGITAIDP